MTQQEKAKRYDEILEWAKQCIKYIPDETVHKYMLNLFPELKESNDERIRKYLIGLVWRAPRLDTYKHHLYLSDVLTWLGCKEEDVSHQDSNVRK